MDGIILIAEDDTGVRKVLSQALTRAGCKVHATSLLTTLTRWVSEGRGDLVITDVAMPDGNGIEHIRQLKEIRPDLPFIVISAQNTITTAIRAEEAAVYSYLPKPFDVPVLLNQVKSALDQKPTRPEPVRGTAVGEDLPLVGRTQVMQSLYKLLAKVMNSNLPLHLVGETGTGKSLIAKVIHELGDRRGLPLITIGPDDLEGSEHLASIFAKSKAGTVVLDEVGDFNADAQRVLVRRLDVHSDPAPRIISTSQFRLDRAEGRGSFRRDLFYRLCGMPIEVPALRQRINDIPLLAEHFLSMTGRGGGKQFTVSAKDLLKHFEWPGNVRQLRSIVQQLSLAALRPEISDSDVKAVMEMVPGRRGHPSSTGDTIFSEQISEQIRRYFNIFGDDLPPVGVHLRVQREVEKPLIEVALDATGGNNIKCAEVLGINRNTLRKKIKNLGISGDRRKRLT